MNILSSVLVLVICKINFDFAQLMKSEREDKENVKTEEKLEKDNLISKRDNDSDIDAEDRIVGGTEATYGKYPFYVQLKIQKTVCGGTIISAWEIITAAHCVYSDGWIGAEEVEARTGDFTRSDDDEEKSSVTYAIRQYRFFQQYTGDVVNGWDVVILETKTEIHLDNYRKIFATICEDDDRMRPVRAIGMGLTDSEKATRPHTLMEANLVEVPERECLEVFGHGLAPLNSEVCVKAMDKVATCMGDSGGPVFVTENDEPKCLYGLVSYGRADRPCGSLLSPTVFAKISFYYPLMAETGIRVAYSFELKSSRCLKIAFYALFFTQIS